MILGVEVEFIAKQLSKKLKFYRLVQYGTSMGYSKSYMDDHQKIHKNRWETQSQKNIQDYTGIDPKQWEKERDSMRQCFLWCNKTATARRPTTHMKRHKEKYKAIHSETHEETHEEKIDMAKPAEKLLYPGRRPLLSLTRTSAGKPVWGIRDTQRHAAPPKRDQCVQPLSPIVFFLFSENTPER